MLIVPAEPSHLISMCTIAQSERRLSLLRPVYHLMQAQMVCSETYAFFEGVDDQAPFAIVGGAELPSGVLDVWFVVRPGGLATSLLLAIIRFARAMLGRRPPALCYVEGGNTEGGRLARLCGFEKAAASIGSFEQWRRG